MNEAPQVVDLTEIKGSEDVLMLSGKDPGLNARAHFHLDDLDGGDTNVLVKIPVRTVTSSFILGMFSSSVIRLGVEGFFDKYDFDARPNVIENIKENIQYAAISGTALDA